jgi:hypothetical protein
MNRSITDADVARLPIREGRAELLEEIMSLSTESAPEVTAPPRRHRWLPALAAAASVAAVVGGVVWLGEQKQEDRIEPAPAPAGSGDRAVLEQSGWTVGNVDDDPRWGGEISYQQGDRDLSIHWRLAAEYDDYVADRNDIGTPEQVDLLGKESKMWAYNATDHTVIRPVEGAYTLEVRGSGMDESAFRALLDDLVLVDRAGLQDALPAEAVTDAERPGVIADMLAQLPLPQGFDRASVPSDALAMYHLTARVTGTVTCAWIDEFARAKKAGDSAGMQAAQDALASSRTWAPLKAIVDEGDWSEVVWDFAAQVGRGKVPLEYREGLGCD